jgi:hypothetical protein
LHVLFQCQGHSWDRSDMYLCLQSSQLNSCRSEVAVGSVQQAEWLETGLVIFVPG